MSDVGLVAGAVTSISDLVAGILDRSDRDSIEKEKNENIVKLQNFFANNDLDSDAFRLFVDQLFNGANIPITPTGDADTGRREFIHASLLAAITLISERQLFNKAFQKISNPK
jgi:hypothetical protein